MISICLFFRKYLLLLCTLFISFGLIFNNHSIKTAGKNDFNSLFSHHLRSPSEFLKGHLYQVTNGQKVGTSFSLAICLNRNTSSGRFLNKVLYENISENNFYFELYTSDQLPIPHHMISLFQNYLNI